MVRRAPGLENEVGVGQGVRDDVLQQDVAFGRLIAGGVEQQHGVGAHLDGAHFAAAVEAVGADEVEVLDAVDVGAGIEVGNIDAVGVVLEVGDDVPLAGAAAEFAERAEDEAIDAERRR